MSPPLASYGMTRHTLYRDDEDDDGVRAGDETPPRRLTATGSTIEETLDFELRLNPNVCVDRNYELSKTGDSSMCSGSNVSVASGLIAVHETEDMTNFVIKASPHTLDETAPHRLKEKCMQGLFADLKDHLDKTLTETREQTRRDFHKVLLALQQESAKRTAMEGRLHSHILLQSETMVAMELKLLRLEAKVKHCGESAQRTNRSSTAMEETARQMPSNVLCGILANGAARQTSVLTDGEGDFEYQQDHGIAVSTIDDNPEFVSIEERSHPIISGGSLDGMFVHPMVGETEGTSTRATGGEGSTPSSSMATSTLASTTGTSLTREEAQPARSRSQSPLTVQTFQGGKSFEPQYSAAGSIATSLVSTTAVAPVLRYVGRSSSRSAMANQVVTFDTNLADEQARSRNEPGDSITVNEELEILSEVADSFAASSRLWHKEYEARLDEIQKRWTTANERG